jgi:hypothetical protein
MSKEKPIIRVAYLGLDAKINHKELDEIKKANPGCDVRVCLINTDFHSKLHHSQDLYDQLLNSAIHEALKGFRIEEIYDSSLLEDVIRFHKQK